MTSKFKSILSAAKEREDGPPSPAPEDGKSKRGRKATGKRSDQDYLQITAYIQRDTHQAVKLALLKDAGRKDFSDLVQELLADWLKART
jgi:hypothetical protein